MKLSTGDVIDQKYQIVRLLGTGGMGSVYEATNLRVGRRVAIKVMHQVRDQQDVVRFEREARAAQIGSPYIVQVHDLGYLADGAPYMVMEYLSGESLGQRIHRVGKMRPSEVLPIAKEILEALAAAHRIGIVHRDLKPDNVFLSRNEGDSRETVKLVDFGISKFIDGSKTPNDPVLTKTGVAVGTPQYMSPEQVQGSKSLDGRSDLYSLGVMLYRCLGGQLPFNAHEVAPLLLQILLEVPPPLRELAPELDRELVSIVTRAMARRADDRFQSAPEFLQALSAWEMAHSGNLDAPRAPLGMTAATQTVNHGTDASWSSVTGTPAPTGKHWRVPLLVASFSIAGAIGVLVARKLWFEQALPATLQETNTLASVTAASVTASAATPPQFGTPIAVVPSDPVAPSASSLASSLSSATPPTSALTSVAPSLPRVQKTGRNANASEAPSPAKAVAVQAPAPPSTPTPVAAPAPPVVEPKSTPVVASPAPAVAPPKTGTPAVSDDNRHLLGDLL